MALVSNTGTLTIIDASGLPSWVPSSVGTWAQIPGTNMSAVVPSPTPPGTTGPQSRVIAWTSFAIDTRDSRIFSCANGGHQDYGGNEAVALVLETNSPGWTMLRTSSTSPQFSVNYYSDGRPTAKHSYYNVTFDPFTGSGRVLMFGGFRYASGGEYTHVCDAFNLNNNDYAAAGTLPNQNTNVTGSGGVEGYAVAADTSNGNAYFFGNNFVYRLNRSANTITQLSSAGVYGRESACAFDSSRNRFLIVGGDLAHHHTWDVAAGAMTSRTFSGTAASAVQGVGAGAMAYVPSRDSFLLRAGGSGSTIYEINASTFACTAMTTTGGGSIPSTLNGPYHKGFFAPNLKCFIYIPSHSGNAWALRVEA